MKDKIIKLFIFLSFLFLLTSIFNAYLRVKVWDYDFWWHLATGRYIVENRALPDKDPFSFVNNLEENKDINPARSQLILKQYWLAQVLFYKVYDYFGEKGIIILRAGMLLIIPLLILWWFKRQGVSFYISYPFVFLVFLHSTSFTGERPVLFTLLFTVVVFFILEEFKRNQSKIVFSLVPLMLLWSNLHGGFLIGIIMILTYVAGETVNFFLRRGEMDKRALVTLYSVGIAAVIISVLNPNGFDAFLAFSSKNKLFQKGIQEYTSPFTAYKLNVRSIDWEYIVLLLLVPVLIILRNKKINIIHYVLLFGFMYMSLSALRFVIYFVCIAAMILGRELHYVFKDFFRRFTKVESRFEYAVVILVFVSSLLFISGVLDFNKVTFTKAVRFSVPEGAADFIKSEKIEGNMFNDMGFGGYFSWCLYPWKKVFIDTRSLNYVVNREYGWIMNAVPSIKNPVLPEGKVPLWERLIDHYNIDIIVVNTMDVYGTTPPLIFELVESDKWTPVYIDIISVIFLRNKEENMEIINKYLLDTDFLYNAIIARISQYAIMNRNNPRYMLSLGDIFYKMKRYEDALTAYEYADRRLSNATTKFKIQQVRKEMGLADVSL